MRFLILSAVVCLMAWSSPEFRAWSSSVIGDPVDPHAVAAIELRCATEMDSFHDDCARELQREFDLGVRDPEMIVRRHCIQFSSDWAPTTRAPLPICEEIYGGWIEG
jgi:hypothetical protein